MTSFKTELGNEHFAQRLDGGVSLDNAFDAIELGSGNTGISTSDDRSDLLNKIVDTLVEVEATYPKVDDSDVTNSGRGPQVLSYKFIIPSGVAPFTATNLILTNFAAGSPAADEPVGIVSNGFSLVKEPAIALTIFVNVRVV